MPDHRTIGAILCSIAAQLREAGIPDPKREARLLLAHALGLDQSVLLIDRARLVDASAVSALAARRVAREPLALITGRQGFWTLDLAVSPATLIPRADTETLVEAVLDARPDRGAVLSVLDLGTGTGCLLLAVLAEYRAAWGIGLDLAPDAVLLAAGNARHNGLAARCAFAAADWAAPVRARFDLVLSNPPYIPAADIAGLMPEVAAHEPRRALDGGADGLDEYRRLIAALPDLLAPNGLAVFELGIGQADSVAALAAQAGFTSETRADLGGVARAILLRAMA